MATKRKDDLDSIRSYYDHNTPRFLSYGEQRKTRTIHRPVWGEGVKNERQALHYVHDLLFGELLTFQNSGTRHLTALDLGCGVGASLIYLTDHLEEDFTGIGLTISPVQVRLAQHEQLKKDPDKRCKFIVGDFLFPPIHKQFDLIFSIEAFAHSAKPNEYFQSAARLLKPGGRLVLCDDFLSDSIEGNSLSPRKKQWLKYFQKGWGVNGIWQPNYVQMLAGEKDLFIIKDNNLTPYLQLAPLPISVIELLAAGIGILPGKNHYLRSVIGGQALQLCLAHEIVEYRYQVFEKGSS
jgi:SAM-dependent methyltransferase